MRTARSVLILVMALLIASPLLAADKKRGAKKAPPCPAAQRAEKMLEGVTLTADQKAKLAEVTKECGPKLAECMKKMNVLTPDQKKAQEEATKAAKAAGKSGKELFAAVAASVKLTDEQKAKMAEARKEMAPIEKDLREKVLAILTDDQKAQVKKNLAPKKKA
jgi:hypothetical protein